MKPRRLSSLFSSISRSSSSLRAAALLLAVGTGSSLASTLWWDGGASTVNSGSDNATTTAQTWLSGGNWDNGITSAPVASWALGDSAVFGGTAASQTITAGALTIGNLTFGQGAAGTGTTGTAYTISGGTLTLAGTTITSNTPTAVNSVLSGTSGLTTAGSSTLTLGGNNSYTGDTSITSGTLKISPASTPSFRYYRFTVTANNGDGYNQIGELHYYNNGVWTAATAGSAAPTNGASGTEQYWGNVNDNKGANVAGFTKFGVNAMPYSIVYDFGAATSFNGYNWSTANDTTPARNPKRWVVSGSNDNSFWVPLDDRSAADNAGPSATYNWSSPTGAYSTVTNAVGGGGTSPYSISTGNLPGTTNVLIASGAKLDLNGCVQIVGSLGDLSGGGGSIINSAAAKPVSLGLNAATGTASFSGAITDSGSANAIGLLKIGAGTQIIAGNNTNSGTTSINAGLIQLASGGHLGTGVLNLVNGSFDTNGQNQTVSNLTGTGGSVTNSAGTDSTLTISLPASTAGNFAGTLTSPSTGKLNLTVNSTSGGSASNVALSNAANTFKGTITVNGTGFVDGVDGHGVLGFNTEGALGDPTNPIVLTNGGAICNMFNPASGGGWPGHAVFSLGATRTITVNSPLGGVVRVGYSEQCTINSLITGNGAFSKVDGGGVTLGGTISNNYTGGTNLGGNGKLILAKTGGAVAIPGDINLASTGGNGNLSGIVLAGDEQIVDTSIMTWATASLAGGAQGDSFFRLNGHTETVGGLVSLGNGPKAVIENRGLSDTGTYGTGTVIINVTGTNSYNYNGSTRDMDQGTGGGAVAITKIGTGTQILSGTESHSGATTVTDGILEVDGTINNSPITVSGTGTLTGTGNIGKPATVTSGGILSPGIGGFGTLTAASPVTIGTGGKFLGTGGTLAGPATIASGGLYTGTGGISGALTVQSGGNVAPGDNGIGNINTTGSVTLSGNATFEINKSGSTRTSDTLTGFTSITYGGTLTIVATGSAPALGDVYQLFVPGAGATFSGSFSSIVGLPVLPAGLQWETTGLIGTGQIKVVNYVSTPSFNPVAGGYIGSQSVTITSDSGSTIYYTTDGSTPTASSTSGSSPVSGIVIPTDSNVVTLRAFARKAGQADSPVATAVYHTVTSPKWNVDASGNWSDPVNWLNSVSPNGAGIPVDFTFQQTSNSTVTLDAARTVGSLTFGNTGGTEWSLDTVPDIVLTLQTSSGTPTITTNDVNTNINALLAGNQGFVKAGPGTLLLYAANPYTGDTAINGGVISVSSLVSNGINSPLGSGSTLSFDGGTLRYAGGTNIPGGTFNRDITLNAGGGTLETSTAGFWFTTGVISGPGSLSKTGTNQLIIQAANTFDGTFFVNTGEVQFRSAAAMGSTVGATVVADGARLCASFSGSVAENLVLNGDGGGNGALQSNDSSVANMTGNITLATNSSIGGGSSGIFTLSGVISGGGGLTKLTANPVTLSGTASNTYTGATTLGGTGKLLLAKTGGAIAIPGDINLASASWNGNSFGVVLGGDEQIADSSIITWISSTYGGTLRLNGHTETVGGLVSGDNVADPVVENRGYSDGTSYGTGTLIIQTAGSSSYNYGGNIRNMDGGSGGGAVAIVKTGTGTQILRGNMSNSGTTTINAGALQLDGSAAFPVVVATGGTLKGTGTTSGTLTVNAGGTLAPGSDFGTLTAGATTIAGTYAVDGDGSLVDRITVNGSLTITGATLAINATSPLLETSYVIASYTGTLTGTFATVTGMPSGSSLQYDAANKQILLVQTVAGYTTWATAKGLTGANNGLSQDPDQDGITNLMEFYLDGNPLASSGNTLLTQSLDATYLTLTFHRRDDANGDVATQSVQYGSSLIGWTDVPIGSVGSGPDANGVVIDVAPNGTDPDTINVHIPRSLAATGKLFGRLKVTK